jgi:xanthine/uracil permease
MTMKLTDWLALIPAVQNGWTLAALIAVLLYLYFSRRGA